MRLLTSVHPLSFRNWFFNLVLGRWERCLGPLLRFDLESVFRRCLRHSELGVIFRLLTTTRSPPGNLLELVSFTLSLHQILSTPAMRLSCLGVQRRLSMTSWVRSSATLPPHSSPWTAAAYDVPMALEEEEESESEEELDYDVEYVEFDGRWWECEWVPARQQHCWWLAAADTGPRLAILSGGPRGSSAVDWGDVVLTGDDMGAATFSRWCRLCAGAALCQPTVALEEFPPLRRLARAVRTWKAGHFSFALVSFSLGLVFRCCPWSTAFWIFREILHAHHLVRQWIHVLREALDEFFTLSTLR